jgi:hypothetical protein
MIIAAVEQAYSESSSLLSVSSSLWLSPGVGGLCPGRGGMSLLKFGEAAGFLAVFGRLAVFGLCDGDADSCGLANVFAANVVRERGLGVWPVAASEVAFSRSSIARRRSSSSFNSLVWRETTRFL